MVSNFWLSPLMMTIRCADDAASVLEKHASSSFF
ncbi:hypothetical protein DK52_3252 [Brucella abortus]|nr:hypothetical protein DK52_3252 [Brucella abortus]